MVLFQAREATGNNLFSCGLQLADLGIANIWPVIVFFWLIGHQLDFHMIACEKLTNISSVLAVFRLILQCLL